MSEIKIKRAYEDVSKQDGYRILVDRLWPRGVTKERAQIDEWVKEVAPSTELRKWFHHDPTQWEEFEKRYRKELADKREALHKIAKRAKEGTVTLIYSAKDEEHNQAIVLKSLIEAIN